MKPDKVVCYYDELAQDYDENRFQNAYGRFVDTAERSVLRELLADVSNEQLVVDLPCGTGRLMNFAQIGIDASAEMLKQAQTKYHDKTFYQADATQLPLADNSVDVLISFHFLMHLNREKIDEVFKEYHRVLKPNGRVIFDIPSQKRRALGRRQKTDWHGNQSLSSAEVSALSGFWVRQSYGILWLPIHRFPKRVRAWLHQPDTWLGRSMLKEYSSYLIFELVKCDD